MCLPRCATQLRPQLLSAAASMRSCKSHRRGRATHCQRPSSRAQSRAPASAAGWWRAGAGEPWLAAAQRGGRVLRRAAAAGGARRAAVVRRGRPPAAPQRSRRLPACGWYPWLRPGHVRRGPGPRGGAGRPQTAAACPLHRPWPTHLLGLHLLGGALALCQLGARHEGAPAEGERGASTSAAAQPAVREGGRRRARPASRRIPTHPHLLLRGATGPGARRVEAPCEKRVACLRSCGSARDGGSRALPGIVRALTEPAAAPRARRA